MTADYLVVPSLSFAVTPRFPGGCPLFVLIQVRTTGQSPRSIPHISFNRQYHHSGLNRKTQNPSSFSRISRLPRWHLLRPLEQAPVGGHRQARKGKFREFFGVLVFPGVMAIIIAQQSNSNHPFSCLTTLSYLHCLSRIE